MLVTTGSRHAVTSTKSGKSASMRVSVDRSPSSQACSLNETVTLRFPDPVAGSNTHRRNAAST